MRQRRRKAFFFWSRARRSRRELLGKKCVCAVMDAGVLFGVCVRVCVWGRIVLLRVRLTYGRFTVIMCWARYFGEKDEEEKE